MKCFCKECGGVRGWIWDLPTEAIDNGAMNIELLIANGTSFAVDCYSVAGQSKLCERHETCLEMWYIGLVNAESGHSILKLAGPLIGSGKAALFSD